MPTIFENVAKNDIAAVEEQIKLYKDYEKFRNSSYIKRFIEMFFGRVIIPKPTDLLNSRSPEGRITLSYSYTPEMMKLLIDNGADINSKINGLPLLNYVLLKCYNYRGKVSDIVKILIEKGANVNGEPIRNDLRGSPLYCALKYAYDEENNSCISLLLEHGANPKTEAVLYEFQKEIFEFLHNDLYNSRKIAKTLIKYGLFDSIEYIKNLELNVIKSFETDLNKEGQSDQEIKGLESNIKKITENFNILKDLYEEVQVEQNQIQFKKDLAPLSKVATTDGFYKQMNTQKAELDKDGKETGRVLPGLPHDMINEIKKHMSPATKLLTANQIRDAIDFGNSKEPKGNSREEYLDNLNKFAQTKKDYNFLKK